jgi:glycolate oxidase FAD binding subunit
VASGAAAPSHARATPASAAELAAALAQAAEAGTPLRVTGGRTKPWGAPRPVVLELSTARLDRVVEHNEGDLTAVLEAGVRLAEAQERFAAAGQMLALDPPDQGGATVGGVLAAADSGPLRQRYGGPRDLVVGATVALSDGTRAKSGGKVIKNVAGYDLAKLLIGSLGTLGAITEVAVRLHPRPERTATAAAGFRDAAALASAADRLAHAPLEPLQLDVRWGGGDGALLARFGGATARERALAVARLLGDDGLGVTVTEEDDAVWERQRAGQRSASGTVVRVSALPAALRAVLGAASRLGGRLVGRAGLGLSWLALEDRSPEEAAGAVGELRRALSPAPCAVLDAPPEVRALVDPWPPVEPGALELMRRVKRRFDPAGVMAPGTYVGGM